MVETLLIPIIHLQGEKDTDHYKKDLSNGIQKVSFDYPSTALRGTAQDRLSKVTFIFGLSRHCRHCNRW